MWPEQTGVLAVALVHCFMSCAPKKEAVALRFTGRLQHRANPHEGSNSMLGLVTQSRQHARGTSFIS